jgi:PAS domain S-box-containing protein
MPLRNTSAVSWLALLGRGGMMGRLSLFQRYAIAGLLTATALSLPMIGHGSWGSAATYSFLLGAVMLSSWVGGLGPGIMATVLSTLAADYFLIPPLHTITFDASRVVQLSAFVGIAALISSLNDSRRRALTALAAERGQLEERVVERTAELATANESLRAEMERRERSERNFRGLIDAAPDAILVIDSDGRILKANAEAERIFRYSRDELLGQDVEIIVPERFRAAHHAKRARYDEAPTARTIAGELAGRRADGTEFPVEIRISPLETHGTRSVVGIVRDVTERHRASQLQQRLVHDLAERVKELTALHATGRILNEPGSPAQLLARIVALLPAAWQYSAITGARIAIGDIDARTERFAQTPWLQRAAFRSSDGRQGVIEVTYREERPNAAEGPFLTEERHLIESLAGMLRAYFERVQAEEDRVNLARAEAGRLQAQEANAAKDQFLATLSHELHSPLNVMIGWIQMLRSDQISRDAATRGFDVLDRSVRLQAKLIEDLLDVSRIIAGKLRVEKRSVDLAVVARIAVDAALPAARAKHVALSAAITPSLLMQADPQRLQQVVSNLLTNALKFTPEHGTIEVRVVRVDGRAEIAIHDTGIGIAPELLPRIFDRFQQGDSSTTRKHRGLGLGLAIVKHLVEQHGGQIAASSAGQDCGSTFTVTLPLFTGETVGTDVPLPAPADRWLLSGIRVLVVDDEADARTTLGAMLEQFGADPTIVGSAADAFAEISRDCPDVLLSDVAMPDEDGYALIRRIRATVDANGLPAAALIACIDGDSREHALDAGFQACLPKPVDPAVLATTLATLVHRPE